MVKAVIFDCFGVLVTEGWLPFAEKYFGKDSSKRRQAADLMVAVNRGILDYKQFVHDVAALAGIEEKSAHDQIMQNTPNEELFAYIKNELKPRYRIGLLSNTGREGLDDLFTVEQLAVFDKLVLSYETGYLKPQPEAYQVAAERLGIDTNECVFIDDMDERCAGARRAGMQAICYVNFDQMKSEVDKLLS